MSLQRSRRQIKRHGGLCEIYPPVNSSKYLHRQCYSRHVIPFLPVVRSLPGLAIPEQYRERDRRAFPMLSAIYNSSRTRGNWISVCARRNFPFYRDGFCLCHQPPIQPLEMHCPFHDRTFVPRKNLPLVLGKTPFRLFTFHT